MTSFNDQRRRWLDQIYDRRDLPSSRVLIALLLAEDFNQDRYRERGNLSAWRSQSEIAKRAHMSDRQIRTHLQALADDGLITVKKGGDGNPNVYTATISDRKGTSSLKDADRKPASSLKEDSDRKSSVSRPEAERIQTGSQLPSTSETPDTSEGGRPSGPPASTDVDQESRSMSDTEKTHRHLPDGMPRVFQYDDKIIHPQHGECLVVVPGKREMVVRDYVGEFRLVDLTAEDITALPWPIDEEGPDKAESYLDMMEARA